MVQCKKKINKKKKKKMKKKKKNTREKSFALISLLYSNIGRMLYRIGLPSNTVSPLTVFLRIEPLCFCSCIRQQTRVATNTATAV